MWSNIMDVILSSLFLTSHYSRCNLEAICPNIQMEFSLNFCIHPSACDKTFYNNMAKSADGLKQNATTANAEK